jgi:hypothetical protein
MSTGKNAKRPTPAKSDAEIDAEIDAQMARIDGINGAAGHVITDPVVRGLLRKQAAGDITGDESRAAMRAHHDRKWGRS